MVVTRRLINRTGNGPQSNEAAYLVTEWPSATTTGATSSATLLATMVVLVITVRASLRATGDPDAPP